MYRKGSIELGGASYSTALRMLELYAGKLARTVLRGQGRGNSPALPDGLSILPCKVYRWRSRAIGKLPIPLLAIAKSFFNN